MPHTLEDGTGAIAIVLRNNRGEALAGVAEVFDHISNPAVAEAMVIRRGLQLLQDIACSRVIVEADSLEIINTCNGVSDVLAPYSAIMANCFQIAHGISSIRFQYCPRKANGLAHFLARHAYDNNTMYSWENDPPTFLITHALNGVTLSFSQ